MNHKTVRIGKWKSFKIFKEISCNCWDFKKLPNLPFICIRQFPYWTFGTAYFFRFNERSSVYIGASVAAFIGFQSAHSSLWIISCKAMHQGDVARRLLPVNNKFESLNTWNINSSQQRSPVCHIRFHKTEKVPTYHRFNCVNLWWKVLQKLLAAC